MSGHNGHGLHDPPAPLIVDLEAPQLRYDLQPGLGNSHWMTVNVLGMPACCLRQSQIVNIN